MKKYSIILIISLISLSVYAQYKPEYAGNRMQQDTEITTSVNTGAAIVSDGTNTLTSSYLAPSASIDFSPRLSVEFGLMMSHVNIPVWSGGESGDMRMQQSMNRFFAYTSANYQYSPKMQVYGSVLKEISGETIHSNPYQSNIQSMSFGVNYQISKNIKVGFEMRKQNYPDFSGGFYRPSPFGF